MGYCIVGVSAVKNEADIIEANVRHNLRYLDRMIVLDHDSCDATPRILQSLVDEGLPLTISRLGTPDPSFKQAQFTTALARGAFEKCAADYVMPFDADEFIRAPSRDALEAALNDTKTDVTNMRWQTYVPSAHGERGHPLRSLRWRVETAKDPLCKAILSRRVLERDWRIGRGNHVVFEQVGDNPQLDRRRSIAGRYACPPAVAVAGTARSEGAGRLARAAPDLRTESGDDDEQLAYA